MSLNNFILIQERSSKENMVEYVMTICDADAGYQMGKAERFLHLRDAVKRAQEIIDSGDVEYGIHVDLLKNYPEAILEKL